MISCAPVSPDSETGALPDSGGGNLLKHIEYIESYDGPDIILSGKYFSAGTMYLSIHDACYTEDARFGFHSPSYGGFLISNEMTYEYAINLFAEYLPSPLDEWYLQRFEDNTYSNIYGVEWLTGEDLDDMNVNVDKCEE